MTGWLIRRLASAALTFVGITAVVFAITRMAPGDPLQWHVSQAGTRGVPQEIVEEIRRDYRLDQPVVVQYLAWLSHAATFDFGRTVTDRRPVTEVIAERLPRTVELNLVALLLALGLGIPIGIWTASRAGSAADRTVTALLFVLFSLPSFWVALLLMDLFSLRLGILPLYGTASIDAHELSAGARFGDRVAHFILPVITLAYGQLAVFARFTRTSVRDALSADYVRSVRARGGSELRATAHAFRNALLPLITVVGMTLPWVLSGSVIVERIFQWNGIGMLYFEAILRRDYPVVMALAVLTAAATLLALLVTDIAYGVADPRIRIERRESR